MLKEEVEQDGAMFAEFNELISSQSEKINDLNNCIAQQKEEHGK
ncbi:hypothetical protein ACHAWC_006663, partial [Mediolabrus comicus]